MGIPPSLLGAERTGPCHMNNYSDGPPPSFRLEDGRAVMDHKPWTKRNKERQSENINCGGHVPSSSADIPPPSSTGTQPALRAHAMSIPVSPTSQTVSPGSMPLGCSASRTGAASGLSRGASPAPTTLPNSADQPM